MKILIKYHHILNRTILVVLLGVLASPTIVLAEAGAKSMFADEGATVMMSDDDTAPIKATAPKPKATLISKKSGQPYADADTSASRPVSYAGIQYWIDLQEPNGHSRKVTTSHTFQSGDGIKLQIKSKTAGYLYVLNEDVTGKQTPLYPTKGQLSGLIQANTIYTIPSRGAIRFDNVPGTEKVTIALAKYPINELTPEESPKATTAVYNSEHYSDCANSSGAGSKGMFAEESGSAIDCIRSNHSAGSKGMFAEEDSSSAQPASYSVMPASALEEGQVMFVDFNLTHR